MPLQKKNYKNTNLYEQNGKIENEKVFCIQLVTAPNSTIPSFTFLLYAVFTLQLRTPDLSKLVHVKRNRKKNYLYMQFLQCWVGFPIIMFATHSWQLRAPKEWCKKNVAKKVLSLRAWIGINSRVVGCFNLCSLLAYIICNNKIFHNNILVHEMNSCTCFSHQCIIENSNDDKKK